MTACALHLSATRPHHSSQKAVMIVGCFVFSSLLFFCVSFVAVACLALVFFCSFVFLFFFVGTFVGAGSHAFRARRTRGRCTLTHPRTRTHTRTHTQFTQKIKRSLTCEVWKFDLLFFVLVFWCFFYFIFLPVTFHCNAFSFVEVPFSYVCVVEYMLPVNSVVLAILYFRGTSCQHSKQR